MPVKRLCACGCGEVTHHRKVKFVRGHRPIKPTANGYRRVWVGKDHPLASKDGNCLEHRLVLFNAGIPIPRGAHVHHINEDKLDNRLENLEVITPAEHTRIHIERVGGLVQNQYGVFPMKEREPVA